MIIIKNKIYNQFNNINLMNKNNNTIVNERDR
jgi:hypothetical protein